MCSWKVLIMRAQISLTPTESKKLIAKAVVNMDVVKRALAEGIVVMHPSSSTFFIAEELTGKRPQTPVWVCGVIVPNGAGGSCALFSCGRRYYGVWERGVEEGVAA